MTTELSDCDLIMKGGITSGVVYPHAIQKIATKYRLRSIGGTSAGAIAAAFAAAAEYRRQENAQTMSGFDDIGGVATELGENMLGLFQPTTATKPLFKLLLAAIEPNTKGGVVAMIWAGLRIFSTQAIIGGLLALVSLLIGYATGNLVLGILGVVLSLLLAVILILLSVKRMVLVDLPAQDFGLCTGKTQGPQKQPAFGDWIAQKIDLIADKTGPPLTVGDLRKHGITVATMTTDLSSKRPYRLPLETSIHFFSKGEFDRLFPDNIVTYLCQTGTQRQPRKGDPADLPKDLYQLPVGEEFPVYLVARLSLSFPGLISAVPLWRIDYQAGKTFRRCLFSDGGISSNFPIHFFDAFLPSRPTFGIALDAFDPDHHEDRINLPKKPSQSTALPIEEVSSLPSFLMAILNTAKDWQDKMQSMLPGYAERIVTVRLDEAREGGLNLTMSPKTIDFLASLGGKAGDRLLSQFDMRDQQLSRAQALLPTLEGALASMSEAFDADYAKILNTHAVKDGTNGWRQDPFAKLAEDLSGIGANAKALHDDPGRKSVRQGDVPHADAEMRLVAVEDRVPKGMEGGA
ncbi:MAG: patatin [Silicimonas sp.]|nr:patatin [Silicimonas sp.]